LKLGSTITGNNNASAEFLLYFEKVDYRSALLEKTGEETGEVLKNF
jgi:hypothetical protein